MHCRVLLATVTLLMLFVKAISAIAFVLQPEYHGFGVTVSPNKLSPVSGRPVQEALTKVMTDPAFQVGT